MSPTVVVSMTVSKIVVGAVSERTVTVVTSTIPSAVDGGTVTNTVTGALWPGSRMMVEGLTDTLHP